ncbi:MAG: glutamate synthase subunit beta [Pelotomaculum sp. PtaU1.Bin065]|nr:MAG: glutamate synthase subunit beta [Pelotomaculum sp. PtaU1.Bin065]
MINVSLMGKKYKLQIIFKVILLRVAIIGAGPSGLACALELERRGINPDIFERSGKVGYAVPRVEILLQLFQRPQRDLLHYLFNNFGIKLKPLSRVQSYIMYSSRHTVPIKGKLGYLIERGQSRNAVEVQLAKSLRSKIKFHTHAGYRALASEYDYVVVAEGNHAAANELKTWETTVTAWAKGAIVLGRFDPGTAFVYFNTDFARHGFGSFKPFNSERALLSLQVPYIDHSELNYYWNNFMEIEKFHPEIIETYELFYTGGVTSRQQVDNILLTGNSGGFTDSFLGLGLLPGMISGAMAGKAIAEGLNYERLVSPLISQVKRLSAFRKAFNTMNNDSLDHLIGTIGLPGIKHIIYNTNVDVLNLLYPFIVKYFRKN